MAQVVHVIKESGTRFEFQFADTATPEVIIGELERHAHLFGFNQQKVGNDPQTGLMANLNDATSGFAIKNPKTIITVGQIINGQFVETKRLRGPKEGV